MNQAIKTATKAAVVAKLVPHVLGLVTAKSRPRRAATVGAVAARAKKAASLDRALAGVSIALGLGELAMPGKLAGLVGLRPTKQTVAFTRAFGAREVAEGAAILASPRPAYGLWSRVAGDAVDLSVLGRSLADPLNRRGRLVVAVAAAAGVTAVDVWAGMRATAGR